METIFSRCTWKDAGGTAEVSLHRGRGKKDEVDKLTLPHSRDCTQDTQCKDRSDGSPEPPTASTTPPQPVSVVLLSDEEQWGR